MDILITHNNQRNRFLKLSLKKNKTNSVQDVRKDRSSDVIIIDESIDHLPPDTTKSVKRQICSTIVINDSSDIPFDESAEECKEPSKSGKVSLNCTLESPIKNKDLRPSIGGWSPAQNIICATPKNDPVPTTPKDRTNETSEQCSIKTIKNSYYKLLNDLYGDKWKSIPSLFKTIAHKHNNFDGVAKKLFNDDEESDKENIKSDLAREKELYLTGSDIKQKVRNNVSDGKCKKKLYTEKIPNTPDLPRQKVIRKIDSTRKKKGMTVTELVGFINKDVDTLTDKIQKVKITIPEFKDRFSFVGSLADDVPSWKCHPEAIQYRDNYKTLKEKLARRLFTEFNKVVFDNAMDADLPILWDTKLRSTAGTTTNRLVKTANGERIRTSNVKLSTKVVDGAARLRDTLIHELCHAATWLIDGELRAGHGPLWKKWAKRSLRSFPELGDISRCHDMEIHYKYCYKCTRCGYSIKRHSKSIDVTKKCCGYCRGTFEIIVNKKNKDGVVVSTPARKGGVNEFALYVKENYSSLKDGTKTHAQVMKILGEQYSAKKCKIKESDTPLTLDSNSDQQIER